MNLNALIDSIEAGDVQAVAEALRAEPKLATASTELLDTPLHIACWHKQLAIVELLLAHRPDVNARGNHGRTPLHCVVHEGRKASVPIVKRLVESGADPSLCDENGFSVAAWARSEMWEALDVVLQLIDARPAPARPVPTDFAAVVARTRDIEQKNHTAVALSKLLEAFVGGSAVDAAVAMAGLPAADARCVRDAAQVLAALGTTSWSDPLREWIRDTSNAARVTELVERYGFSRKA